MGRSSMDSRFYCFCFPFSFSWYLRGILTITHSMNARIDFVVVSEAFEKYLGIDMDNKSPMGLTACRFVSPKLSINI